MITFDSVNFRKSNLTFTSMAQKLPARRIINAADAIAQWDLLRYPKYSAIIQEEEVATDAQRALNRQIRESNYSFLDELTGNYERSKFIDYFKRITGFPNMERVSQKIVEEFSRVLKLANENLFRLRGETWSLPSQNRVLMSGYDEFCSVGLKTALPGSDMDKGYAIIDGVKGDLTAQKAFSDRVKGEIWNNIDNRIMSVNHLAAFPNIMTDKELATHIAHVDRYARNFVSPENLNYFRYQRLDNGNIISGARFNIWLSSELPTTAEKYDAKNLAYIVETMRDGKHIRIAPHYEEPFYNLFQNSEFCHCSNVIQSKVMQNHYDYGESMKPKLIARKEATEGFNSWSISRQYELVKDIIRSMSGDSKNPQFADMFRSKNDRGRLLLNDILRGKVECAFDNTPYGERATLFFSDGYTAEKYADINIYRL